MLLFDLIVIFSHFHVVGPSDDAPKQRAVHLKKWIVELKNKSWSHFAQDKLGSRKKFDPKELIDDDIRTFDRSPEHPGSEQPSFVGLFCLFSNLSAN